MKLKKMLLTLTAAAVLAVSIPFAAMAVNPVGRLPCPPGTRPSLCPALSPPRRGQWSP